MKLTGVFAFACILICLMGLFGLAAFTTEQRTKEIGIRKVLGASDLNIVTMLSRHTLQLVAYAAVPAGAATWYLMDRWLERFAYRTEISWIPLVASALVVAFVALLTVTAQSLKAARAKPIDALRHE